MAYRDRGCKHLQARKVAQMPQPSRLGALAPYMGLLIDCAGAYEDASSDKTFTSAPEFVTWLDVEVQRAANFGKASPIKVERPVLREHDLERAR